MQEYVLIYQHIAKVERFLRQASSEWLYTRVDGLEGKIELPSIGCSLALSDLYERIDFDAS